MRNDLAGSCLGLVMLAASVAAQTTVITSGTTSSGTVPVFGPALNTTVTNSPIIVNSGNVGIGTTTPAGLLDINNPSDAGGVIFAARNIDPQGYTLPALANTGKMLIGWNHSGGNGEFDFIANRSAGNTGGYGFYDYSNSGVVTNLMTMRGNGDVGIGTMSPSYPLDVYSSSSVQAQLHGYGAYLSLNDDGPTSGYTMILGSDGGSQRWAIGQSAWSGAGNGMAFYSGSTEAMRLNSSGNIGIGTTTPQAKLEINGNLRFTADGSVQTTAWTGVLCGGDYAEAMSAAGGKEKYEPGDVLVLASENNSDVQKSSESYSTMVAGIVATKAGVVGLRAAIAKLSDNVPMAMVGVVPTKVSAENGPIHRGDLLVTASLPGFAMKGTDRSRMLGAVIGKAMDSLDSGKGVIEVLVTLQ